MLQNKQNIYLFLAAAATAGWLCLPLATASGDPALLASMDNNFYADGTYWALEFFAGWMLFFNLFGIIKALFQYRNPVKQKFSLGMLLMLSPLILILIASMGLYYANYLPAGCEANLSIWSALMPLEIVFLILAYRAIPEETASATS